VRVWDVRRRRELARFTLDDVPRSCALAPDGLTIVVGCELGTVHFLRLEGIEPSGVVERDKQPVQRRSDNLIADLCGRLRKSAGA